MSIPSSRQARMIEQLRYLAPAEGYTRSMLEGVTLMRSNRPVAHTQALYEPSVVIVLQGRKRGFHGGSMYVYDAGHYLVLSVPLPFSTQTEATETEPMLGLALRIDPAVTAELAMGVDGAYPHLSAQPATLYASPMEASLEDCTARLLDVLCAPGEAAILGPSICREMLFRVLMGEQGGGLRAALAQGGSFNRIARVLRRIHAEFDRNLDVATLAGEANMSIPAFHAQFKSVTATTPIQYIKAIRLHEARLMMIRSGMTAAAASGQVGYESPSQFSREFKRLFGRSPADEARALKSLFSLAAPVGQAGAGTVRDGAHSSQ